MLLAAHVISWRAGAGRWILDCISAGYADTAPEAPSFPSRLVPLSAKSVTGGPPQARSSFLKDERRILRQLRALTLLELVAQSERPVSLAALTEASAACRPCCASCRGWPTPAAARARQQELRQRLPGWRAGARRHDQLAAARRAPPHPDSLVDEIGETCNCTMLDGDEVVYLDRVENRLPLRVNLQPGSRVPLHCSASGKLFLAHMRREARERLLAAALLPRYTPNTLCDMQALDPEFRSIRRKAPASTARSTCWASSAWPCRSCTATAPWPPWRCTRRWRACPSTRPAPGCRACAAAGGGAGADAPRRMRADAGRLNAPLS